MKELSKNEPMPTCKLSQLRKIYTKTLMLEDSTDISLEFVLVGLFPTVWNNVQQALTDQYAKGYLDGLKESKDESKRSHG